jgi:enoyl-CoA hydratase/carnithine racemase
MDLALMCDLRVASSSARFGQPQVKLGVPASFELIRSIVSEPVARELCLTARVIDADEALKVGLINEMVAPGAALDRAEALAFDIAEVAGAAAMKQMFVAAQSPLFGDGE